MNITYKNGKTYELKNSFRAKMLFENVKRSQYEAGYILESEIFFRLKTLSDYMLYLYCMILAQEKNEPIDYDEYIDWLDDNGDVFEDYMKWLVEVFDAQYKKQPIEKKPRKTKKENKDEKN